MPYHPFEDLKLSDFEAYQAEVNLSTKAGAARRAAAVTIAIQQRDFPDMYTTGSGTSTPTKETKAEFFRRTFFDALISRGLSEDEARPYLDSLAITQATVDAVVLPAVKDPTFAQENEARLAITRQFFTHVNYSPSMTVDAREKLWKQLQDQYGVSLSGGPPPVEGEEVKSPDLLSPAGEEVVKQLNKHRTAKTLTMEIVEAQMWLEGVTDTDRVVIMTDFVTGDVAPPVTVPGPQVTPAAAGLIYGTTDPSQTGPVARGRFDLTGRTLIGLSGTYEGPSPTTEYQRLQIEIANGRLRLDEAKQQWTETKEKFWQARATATEKLNREEFERSIFESDRTTRLRRDESLLAGRLRAAASGTSALVAAAPYLAPKSEFLPGQEPGGSLERLKAFSGAQHTPVRTADASVPFNPFEAAEQALADFERTQGAI